LNLSKNRLVFSSCLQRINDSSCTSCCSLHGYKYRQRKTC